MSGSAENSARPDIAFFGLGMMGLPMASRLVKAGFAVRGYDPVEQARHAFGEAGGRATALPADAADGAGLLITMLPNGDLVRAALLEGKPNVAQRLAPGAVVIDMSSSSPIGTQTLGADLAALGLRLIDAPVSGGVRRAVDGTLSIMTGGDADAIASVTPALRAMGESIFPTGPLGSGHAMKALNNYVSAAGLMAACEALQIGARFGLDPALMTDVLNASTGRNNSTQVKLKPFVINGTYASGFSLALMAKDLRIADDLARHADVPAPLSHVNAFLWEKALSLLGKDVDHTAIDRFVASPAADAFVAAFDRSEAVRVATDRK